MERSLQRARVNLIDRVSLGEVRTLGTKGASRTTAVLRWDNTSHHSRAEVTTSIATTAMKNNATMPLRRSLMISRAAFGSAEVASDAACARNPSFGSAEKTF